MLNLKAGRSQAARLHGLTKNVRYPLASANIEFRIVGPQGQSGPQVHTLQLIVTDHEARQLAEHFAALADEISQAGGSKQ